MMPEDHLLLACTRQHFTNCHQQRVLDLCRQHSICWEILYQTAEQHGVAPLVYTNLKLCPLQRLEIPQPVLARFDAYTMRTIALKSAVAVKLRDVLAFFNQRGIDVMLVKGVALELLDAHAWVEQGGRILVGEIRDLSRFTSLASFKLEEW